MEPAKRFADLSRDRGHMARAEEPAPSDCLNPQVVNCGYGLQLFLQKEVPLP